MKFIPSPWFAANAAAGTMFAHTSTPVKTGGTTEILRVDSI